MAVRKTKSGLALKRWFKEKAKELYPKIKKITLATADSILIAKYAKEEFFNK